VSYSRVDPIAKATLPVNGEPRIIQFQPHNNYNASIAASYVIYDWGRFKESVKKTVLEIQQQSGGIEILKHTLAYQVSQLYFSIIYLQKAILVQQDQVKLVQENGKIITDRIKSGDALEYDAVQVQVRYKNAEMRVVDLQGQLERQYIFLSSLIGSDARKSIPINAELQFVYGKTDMQSTYNEAIVNNVDLKGLLIKESVLAQEVKISSMSSLPTLAANASLGVRNGYLPDIVILRPNSLIGVKLSIPIYTGKRGEYNTQIAKINLDAAKQGTESQKIQISRDLENAYNDIKVANQKKELAASNIFQAEYSLKLAKKRLENGVSTPLEIQSAETGLAEAKFNLLQYDYQALLAKLEISRLSGVKFW
jgi:outer membrane protein TolC